MFQHPSEDAPVFALSGHDITPTNTDSLSVSVFFLSFNFMFSPSLFTQVYIIIYSLLPDCFKMTPTGTACLTMAVLHTLPKTRIAFTPRNQRNTAVILQFPFITNGNKMQWWREIEGNIQMILAPGYACGGGELVVSRCG